MTVEPGRIFGYVKSVVHVFSNVAGSLLARLVSAMGVSLVFAATAVVVLLNIIQSGLAYVAGESLRQVGLVNTIIYYLFYERRIFYITKCGVFSLETFLLSPRNIFLAAMSLLHKIKFQSMPLFSEGVNFRENHIRNNHEKISLLSCWLLAQKEEESKDWLPSRGAGKSLTTLLRQMAKPEQEALIDNVEGALEKSSP